MAPLGHIASQAPQSVHVSASITYFGSPSEIASNAHSLTHDPHMVHSSVILYAISRLPLSRASIAMEPAI